MNQQNLNKHLIKLKDCQRCPRMFKPVVVGQAALSKVILVGQAPGVKEPVLQRPFAWTAGKTLFRWFREGVGIEEQAFRELIYIAAVCRCYPGKNAKGGDRVPDAEEIENCAGWLKDEMQLLKPELVIPVGKLAIQQFMALGKLTEVIGQTFNRTMWGVSFDMIPLPHPSGASTWHRMEPGKTLTQNALKKIEQHPSFKTVRSLVKAQD
jgi:uracil-DNA glycosylase